MDHGLSLRSDVLEITLPQDVDVGKVVVNGVEYNLQSACNVSPDGVRREFVEIVVNHPITTTKEYEGKPYYGIKYIEDGQQYIGFGTYKIEVLSRYIKEYFMLSGDSNVHLFANHADCISRRAAIDAVNAYLGLSAVSRTIQNMTSIQEILENLPSAEPRKKGHWIYDHEYAEAVSHKCSECGKLFTTAIGQMANYCWNCGADMREGE